MKDNRFPGVVIAAANSGSGKTLLTCGLLTLMKKLNMNPIAYKVGPDYIDPMFHKNVLGVASKNLDSFFADEALLNEIYQSGFECGECSGCGYDEVGDECSNGIKIYSNDRIAVVEGVMGIYDGLGGTSIEASTYDVATKLQLPIVLVIDAHGMGRTVTAVIKGIKGYDTENLIKGVILNKTSKMFADSMKAAIEAETGVKYLGCLPKQENVEIGSRHLGLMLPDEIIGIREMLGSVADVLKDALDVSLLLEIIESSGSREKATKDNAIQKIITNTINPNKTVANKRIAVARDEAFCFIYEDNMRMLTELGAEIIYFSPIHDKHLPEKIDGLILCGGYPELYLKELSENETMKAEIKDYIENENPCIAECGGFMYLHKGIYSETGDYFEMCNVIDATCENKGKLVRFGYVNIENDIELNNDTSSTKKNIKENTFLGLKESIKGHEFHYYDSTDNGECVLVKKPTGKRSWRAVHANSHMWLGFPHLYFPSNVNFVKRFLGMSESQMEQVIQDKQAIKAKQVTQATQMTPTSEVKPHATIYGIGVGPGEPELITVKALETIKKCDVIILPAKAKEECYAYKIVKQIYPEIDNKEIYEREFPMTKDEVILENAHNEIYRLANDMVCSGKNVGFLTIGDPATYSTYNYIHKRALSNNINAEMISGVNSFSAVAAKLGISLADGDEEIHIIPASFDINHTRDYSGTRIYMKSGKKLRELIEMLEAEMDERVKEGREIKVKGVSNCGYANEVIYESLDEIKDSLEENLKKHYLTVVIVKETD